MMPILTAEIMMKFFCFIGRDIKNQVLLSYSMVLIERYLCDSENYLMNKGYSLGFVAIFANSHLLGFT